jgi:hypothetical protein
MVSMSLNSWIHCIVFILKRQVMGRDSGIGTGGKSSAASALVDIFDGSEKPDPFNKNF